MATSGIAEKYQKLVPDKPATPPDEDRRQAGPACSLLLVAIGGGPSQPEVVPRNALTDLGFACTWRVVEIAAPEDLVKKKIRDGRVSEKSLPKIQILVFGLRVRGRMVFHRTPKVGKVGKIDQRMVAQCILMATGVPKWKFLLICLKDHFYIIQNYQMPRWI